jgi:hypothetical protein
MSGASHGWRFEAFCSKHSVDGDPIGHFQHYAAAANVMDAPAREHGGVAERLKAPVLKTGNGESRSWVRIPPPPPENPQLRVRSRRRGAIST